MIYELIYKALVVVVSEMAAFFSFLVAAVEQHGEVGCRIPRHLGVIYADINPIPLLQNAHALGVSKVSLLTSSTDQYLGLLNLLKTTPVVPDRSASPCCICVPQARFLWQGLSLLVWKPFEGHELVDGAVCSSGSFQSLSKSFGHATDCEIDFCISPKSHLSLKGFPPQLFRFSEFL